MQLAENKRISEFDSWKIDFTAVIAGYFETTTIISSFSFKFYDRNKLTQNKSKAHRPIAMRARTRQSKVKAGNQSDLLALTNTSQHSFTVALISSSSY